MAESEPAPHSMIEGTSIPWARPVSLREFVPAMPYAGVPARSGPGPWRAVLELLLLIPAAIAGAVLVYVAFTVWPARDPRWYNLASSLVQGTCMLLAAVAMVRLGGQSLSSIGLTTRNAGREAMLGLLLFVVSYLLVFAGAVVLYLIRPDLFEGRSTAQKAVEAMFPRMSPWVTALSMVPVALWEETVFRGFLLTRLHAIVRRWWLAIPLGGLIFAVPHLYQGGFAVVLIMGMAVLMGSLFVLRRSLASCIAFHFANNVFMLLALRHVSEHWQ